MYIPRTSLCACLIVSLGTTCVRADQTLIEFGKDFSLKTVESHDAKVSLAGNALRVDTGHAERRPGVVFKAPGGSWDLMRFQDVTADIKNVGKRLATVHLRVASADLPRAAGGLTESADLAPGEKKIVRAALGRRLSGALRAKLFGMRGLPRQVWSRSIDPANVSEVAVFVDSPADDCSLEISDLRAREIPEQIAAVPEDHFFPMIDAYGQYIHKAWPGKTESAGDLAASKQAEAADLTAHPGPNDRDRYGGWKNGPKLKATGFFRTEKLGGKWWLVDPEGRLFWSYGTNGISLDSGRTPITNRKHWFADLPAPGTPLAQFLSGKPALAYNTDGKSPAYFYYRDKPHESFDFSGANLMRKYGEGWADESFALANRRLHSWGMNTLGCGSDSKAIALRQTPYVAMFGCSSKRLAGSEGYWGPFPDVFDPAFVNYTMERVARFKGNAADDPWCIGFFVENELSWGSDGVSLALATLRSPSDQAAKHAFLDDLRKKYKTIDKLNRAWGTQHASWDALLQSTTPPDKRKARADLEAFYTRTAERYFQVTRDALKEVAPHHLNLGCRFAAWGQNSRVCQAAAKYCDVLSFNHYKHSVNSIRIPEDVDKPVIIGEFHFGALDRGMFHTGLAGTANQAERAKAFKGYLEGALDSPLIVGAHWFEFRDQATTARGDGENYQIGLVDICDTPNPDIIRAAREVGDELYPRRRGQ